MGSDGGTVSGNLLRKLSPREESTLCMIAQGVSSLRALRSADVSRLQNFGFAEVVEGVVTLTPPGHRTLRTGRGHDDVTSLAGRRISHGRVGGGFRGQSRQTFP